MPERNLRQPVKITVQRYQPPCPSGAPWGFLVAFSLAGIFLPVVGHLITSHVPPSLHCTTRDCYHSVCDSIYNRDYVLN